MNQPLIWGAASMTSDPNPAIRALCNAAKTAEKVMSFRRAIVRNLKNPAALLASFKTKPGTATATNAQRLAKVLRNANKAPTQRELNSARLDRVFRKSSL